MVSRDLMVVTEFDGSKILEEIIFTSVPIWVRIMKLPLGMMMDREIAITLGEEIGSYMDVDLEENHSDVGCFLRVKIRLDITTFDEGSNNYSGWEGSVVSFSL